MFTVTSSEQALTDPKSLGGERSRNSFSAALPVSEKGKRIVVLGTCKRDLGSLRGRTLSVRLRKQERSWRSFRAEKLPLQSSRCAIVIADRRRHSFPYAHESERAGE